MPDAWLGYLAPQTPSGYAFGDFDTDFTRVWATIGAITLTTTLMCLVYDVIKSPRTRLNDDKIIQAFLISRVYVVIAELNSRFGGIGFNPA